MDNEWKCIRYESTITYEVDSVHLYLIPFHFTWNRSTTNHTIYKRRNNYVMQMLLHTTINLTRLCICVYLIKKTSNKLKKE